MERSLFKFAVMTLLSILMPGTLIAENELPNVIRQESSTRLEQILKANPELANQPMGGDSGHNLPLGLSILLGKADHFTVLADAGADINAVNDNDMTPLMAAASTGNSEFVSQLLKRGAEVNLVVEKGLHGRCAIDFAAKEGKLKVVELLLKNKADLSVSGALEYALAREHFEVANLLLDHRADPNAPNVMEVAAERAPLQLLEKMIGLGGNVNTQHFYANVLGHAADSADKTGLLIRHGAEVNASKQNGHRALHNAASSGNISVATLLIANGAEIDVRKADKQRPLDIAILRDHLPMVRFLIDSGAEPTVHSMVALGQNKELDELLSNQPEEISKPIPGSEDTVPIFTAIRFGNNGALSILLEKGVDPNSMERFFPALHSAVMKGNVVATKKLLEYGANVNTALSRTLYMNPSSTPLHLAITGTGLDKDHTINFEMVELLLSHGADPHKSSSRQRSPLEIAEALKNEPLLELLRKHAK